MPPNVQFDVAIIGAGVSGCAIARELAPHKDVVVIEKDNIASGATGQASGNTSVVTGFHDYPDFAHYCNSFFREYDGTSNFSYTERPRITLIPSEIESDARETAKISSNNGFSTSYLTSKELEKKYSGIFYLDNYAGGIEYQDIGWVDPYTYTMNLKKDAEDMGAEIRTGVPVNDILTNNGHVVGVETEDTTIDVSNVVCAVGWQTRSLLSGLVEVPVYPMRWQTIDLNPGKELNQTYPMGLDLISGLYWRREHNGNLHVGGGEIKVDTPGSSQSSVTEEFRRKVAKKIPRILQGLDTPRVVSEHACRTGDSTTPDTLPIIDTPHSGPDGLVVAAGFHGRGIMASPGTAACVRSIILNEECPFDLSPFSIDRFETQSDNFEFTKILENSYGIN